MRLWIIRTAGIAALSVGLAVTAAQAGEHSLTVGSGEVSGVFYPEAGAVCRVVNKDRARHGLRCLVEPTAGSAANIAALKSGDQQLAIVQSKALAQAVAGSGPFAKAGPSSELRSLLSLHGEAVVVVLGANSKIKSLADLKGRRVNLGHPGSYQRAMAEALLQAEGLTAAQLGSALEMEPDKQVKSLCENQIDAAVFSGLHPMPEVQEALDECGASLLPLKDAAIEAFLKDNPAFSRLTIPADDYQGLKEKVPTIGLRAVLVTTDKLPAEDAYQVVKAVLENLGPLKAMHAQLGGLDKKTMTREGLAAPLHDGAKKYFTENGLP
ncbi:MAG TPA: TAXI family TRAP transporter solute-binding subunit [Patescibacteria group bacterium]|nr:TAXI family TRAP transporter solute-binding subunit [Patescibacteria group bacterium]